MEVSTKTNSLIAGVPIGFGISWLNSLPEDFFNSSLIPEVLCSLIMVSYFLLSMGFIVIGVTSIKKRINTSAKEALLNPIEFFNCQLQIFLSDSVKMVIYFIGAVIGGVLWFTL